MKGIVIDTSNFAQFCDRKNNRYRICNLILIVTEIIYKIAKYSSFLIDVY